MSYSRWSNSIWYTYWSTGCSDKKNKQTFCICSVATFTYKQLKDDIYKCLKEIKKKYPTCTDYEIEELRGYMKEFMADVEHEFTTKKGKSDRLWLRIK
jgi:hypothetical protein